MASFWFVEALKQRHEGTLDLDTDTITMYLLQSPSVWTPDDTETNLTTARGDELTVGGYSPQNLTITVGSDATGSNCAISSPVTFSNVDSGENIAAVLLGKASTTLPIAYMELVALRATTGGDVNVNVDPSDLRVDTDGSTNFWFVEATKQMNNGSLVMDTDTITAYLLGPASVWTPSKTTTSLTTARGDELSSYTPLTVTTTIVSDINSSDVRVTPKPLVFTSVGTGQTLHAVLLGKSSSNLPISYHTVSGDTSTTGQNVEVTFDNADLITKNE